MGCFIHLPPGSMVVDLEGETDILQSYPEAVNYPLETYATDEVIAKAYSEVIYCKQAIDKTETEFAELVRAKARRCCSVFSERRLKSIFVDGLLCGKQATVRNHLASSKRLSYAQVTQYAQSLGDSPDFTRHHVTPEGHGHIPDIEAFKMTPELQRRVVPAIHRAKRNKATGIDELFSEAFKIAPAAFARILTSIWVKCSSIKS